MSNSDLRFEHSDLCERDVLSLKVVVVFERNVSLVPLVVRGTVSFLEASELLTHLHLALEHSSEVPSGEQTVVRDKVVSGGGLKVVQVREAGSV